MHHTPHRSPAVNTIAAVAFSLLGLTSIVSVSRGQEFNTEAMAAFASRLFDRIDLDHDGRLTEMEHHVTGGGGFMSDFKLLDLDGNGVVTKDEYIDAVRRYHPPGGPRKLI